MVPLVLTHSHVSTSLSQFLLLTLLPSLLPFHSKPNRYPRQDKPLAARGPWEACHSCCSTCAGLGTHGKTAAMLQRTALSQGPHPAAPNLSKGGKKPQPKELLQPFSHVHHSGQQAELHVDFKCSASSCWFFLHHRLSPEPRIESLGPAAASAARAGGQAPTRPRS